MNAGSKTLSNSVTHSQNMDFIKEKCATAYLSSTLDFHFSVLLRGIGWLVTNILGQQIGSNFKSQDVQEEMLSSWTSCSLRYLVLKCQ
jgi:hypothetical protein